MASRLADIKAHLVYSRHREISGNACLEICPNKMATGAISSKRKESSMSVTCLLETGDGGWRPLRMDERKRADLGRYFDEFRARVDFIFHCAMSEGT